MARCDVCGTTILFGGKREGEYRFCSENCHVQAVVLEQADQVPEDEVVQNLKAIHEGPCPRCGGEGPVDVHTSYRVWSALVMTSWNSKPEVCCHGCGRKSKLVGTVSSLVLGWWGFPFGLLITPVQVLRNLGGLMSSPDPLRPSDQLEKLVRMDLAVARHASPLPEDDPAGR